MTVLLVLLLLALLGYEISAERRWIPARTISEHIWAFERWAGVPGRALVAAGLVLLAQPPPRTVAVRATTRPQ